MGSSQKKDTGSNGSGWHEKMNAMLLDTMPSSVLIIDKNLCIVLANRNFLEKMRRSISDTVGYPLQKIFPDIIVEKTDIINQVRRAFRSNCPFKGQRIIFRSPGISTRTYYYRITPVHWQESVKNVMLLMDDVTKQVNLSEEIQRVQRHLASIFESASDIILSTDTDGKILSWNPAAERISGYSFAEVEGRNFYRFCKADNREMVKGILGEMSGRRETVIGKWNLVTKNGANLHVSWVCSPMKHSHSEIDGIVLVGRDYTEHRKMEAQLLQSQKFAALGVMAGGIAHEIRNPLAVCSSAAQFLQDKEISADFRIECARKIHKGIKRAGKVIENLLEFSRPAEKSVKELINLLDVIKESIALISNEIKLQKISFNPELPAKPVMIQGSAGQLQQLFVNLLLNAIKAMADGGTLTVSVWTKGREVLIRVADTGQGISKENIDKIFDPFFTTSLVGTGIGLGLSICFSIIEQHSGTIEVASHQGRDTIFTITLPLPQ
ncbi:MAG: PAS domain S-box protein [Desulfobacterales bacterium]|nr:PAS domain S-box protein [Desulfobacterales bacterium]